VKAFYPIPFFPTVSLTGTACSLSCPYCSGSLLRRMPRATDPHRLERLLSRYEETGIRGVQVSGGFDPHGRLPLDSYLDVISRHSERLYIVAHNFLVDAGEAARLAAAGIRRVDFPLTLDRRVLAYRGLKATPRDVEDSYTALLDAGVTPVPHILVGELGGRPSGEGEAIGYAAEMGADVIVIIALTPLPGAPASAEAPPGAVLQALRYARKAAPGEVALGCMRPRAVREKVDGPAVREGLVDRVVAPSPSVLRGVDAEKYCACCSVDGGSLRRFHCP